MKQIKQILRFLQIQLILARHGLGYVLVSLPALGPLRYIVYLNPLNWFRGRDFKRGVAIRKALEALGPIFVKFGQALSTRRDLIPDDIADELAFLQDKVPPFSSEKAKKIIEEVYGKPVGELFQSFEFDPLASASIAQVHAAKLLDGSDVVIKILRPGVKKAVKRDLQLLYSLAALMNRFWRDARRFKPREMVAEFERTLIDELDLMREAANASQLKRNFSGSHLLYVPYIYWDYARTSVIVMERIFGIPISDVESLRKHKINIKKLAERGVEIFFTQVFRDCFFHADMHPGNIFVSPDHPDDPRYIAVDFGIMGTLNDSDQRYLAENFLAFFNRDYRMVARLHLESGWIPPETRLDEFESAIRTVSEPIFSKPLKDISFAQMLLRLFETARRFNMRIQPQLILLQKTLFAIEGLGRQLYPDLDLWSTAKPFLEDWLRARSHPKRVLDLCKENFPQWVEAFPEVPGLVYSVLQNARSQSLKTHQPKAIEYKKEPLKPYLKRYALGLGAGTALLITAITSYWLQYSHLMFKPRQFALVLASVGLLSLLYGWYNRFCSIK